MNNARYVSPDATFSKTIVRYSGFALTNMPTKDMYDLTKAESMVVHGILSITSISGECTRSSRDTTYESAVSHSRSCAGDVEESTANCFGLN
jgi:hypothetical protein